MPRVWKSDSLFFSPYCADFQLHIFDAKQSYSILEHLCVKIILIYLTMDLFAAPLLSAV